MVIISYWELIIVYDFKRITAEIPEIISKYVMTIKCIKLLEKIFNIIGTEEFMLCKIFH